MMPDDLHLAAFLSGLHRKDVAVDFTEVDVTADVNDLTMQNMARCFLNALAGFGSREHMVAKGLLPGRF